MSAIILSREPEAYRDSALRDDCPTRRYTAYVVYPVDPAAGALDLDALATAVASGDAFVEEIDVDAATERHAREIAEAALRRDYEPGGRIAAVDERIGWYL